MIIVDNIFVPRHLLTARFTCPYGVCGSMCCVSGDKGAPVTREEIICIERDFTAIKPGLDPECITEINDSGIWQEDEESLNLSCLEKDGRCVFSVQTETGVSCHLETFSVSEQKNTLRPVSCRLFPLRIRRYNGIVILDYEIWDECRDAWNTGEYLLDFCRQGLLETFGSKWLERLDTIRKKALEQVSPQEENPDIN